MGEVNITYELLFDLLRRERSRDDLQPLDPSFYDDVLAYLWEKKSFLDQSASSDGVFSSSDFEAARIQFQNIKRLLKELYDRREKKIINLAITKTRTGSLLVDTSNMLPSEKEFFDAVCDLLSRYRKELLDSLLSLSRKPASFSQSDDSDRVVMVRVLKDIPKFLGKDKVVYGPFKPEDVVSLPFFIASLLSEKGLVEFINSS